MPPPSYITRYFLQAPGVPEVEVTEAQFVAAERAEGIYPDDYWDDPADPATAGFGGWSNIGGERMRGRVEVTLPRDRRSL